MRLSSYLTFAGNCREAMMFYNRCLGGELILRTVGESPFSGILPKRMQHCILQATLKNEHLVLMASDMVNDSGLIKGNAVALMVNCKSESEARTCYQNLSDGAIQTHPLAANFWGALFGDLVDKYGNHWLITFQANET